MNALCWCVCEDKICGALISGSIDLTFFSWEGDFILGIFIRKKIRDTW